jgi:FtsH-binding integral membrane protein
MDQQKLSVKESLSIIEEATKKARQEKTGAAYYLILWGALISLFFLCNYIAYQFDPKQGKQISSLAWNLFLVGGLLSYLHTKKMDKLETTKPLNDSLYMYTWGGVGLCLGVMGMFNAYRGIPIDVTLITLLFGFASFITGGVTRFSASLIGGVIAIVFAGITTVATAEFSFLFGALGVFTGIFVPGIIMNQKKYNVQ